MLFIRKCERYRRRKQEKINNKFNNNDYVVLTHAIKQSLKGFL